MVAALALLVPALLLVRPAHGAWTPPAGQFLPPGIPVNRTMDVDMGSEALIPLQAAAPLPEKTYKGGQINWPIHIPEFALGGASQFDDMVVDNIAVTVRGLYHEWAGDVTMKILHEGAASTLTAARGEERRLGRPAERPYWALSATRQKRWQYGEDLLAGEGYDYRFADLVGNNVALGMPGEQSSSMSGDDTAAWRATDGDIVSSGMATHTDENPWYQVDLGVSQTVGTVVLWAPDPENQINEVQIIKTTGLITLGGSFQLALEHNGFTEATADIQHNAVASVLYEDSSSTDVGTGKGESMQSKIQELGNIGLVSVTRSDADKTGGYEWTVTFLTEHTNLEELDVSSNNLTAGKLRLPEDQVADVSVTTIINGTRNTFYNANMRFGAVLVSDTPFDASTLEEARAVASVEQGFDITYGQRQINVPMPTGTLGRYVRITLKQTSYLSIAELLVFEEEMFSFEVFNGGSPVPAGSYAPELAFADIFGGKEIHGQWLLSITDLNLQEVAYESTSRRRELLHGTGALSDWVLEVTPRNRSTGETMDAVVLTYYVDMTATILTLPKYGTLYEADAYARGELIAAVPGLEVFTGKCAPLDCKHKFGLGNILSTDNSGSVAVPNRIADDRKVIYVPEPTFRGVDSFTYSITLGTHTDPRVGTVTLRVKRCRVDCANDRLFGVTPTIDESLATPWDDREPVNAPPDKILQPDVYGAKLWNDPYCSNPPCNVFDGTELIQ